jgi:hypothetical protein
MPNSQIKKLIIIDIVKCISDYRRVLDCMIGFIALIHSTRIYE